MSTTKYIHCGYESFIKNWQNYYKENFLTFSEELALLKANLNAECIKEIDNFVEIMLFKIKLPVTEYMVKESYIYSAAEISKAKKESFNNKEQLEITTKYKLLSNFHLEIPVFRYHCGLKLLPFTISQKINNSTVIDGGAYFGDSALIFNKYNPHKIYAFEPSSVNYGFLKQTVNNNKLNNVITPVNYALGNCYKNISLGFNSFKLPNLGAGVAFNTKDKNQETVNMTTLDAFVSSSAIKNKIGLIKLDLEGFELEAIWGAKNTIIEHKPILLIAIYHTAEEFLKIKPYLESLNLGYKFLLRTLNHGNILREFCLIAYTNED